jgi:hypothetical protein
MPDTAANQASYPRPSSQALGVGSPLARLVGVIYLSTGALLEAAIGPHAGKGTSELGLLCPPENSARKTDASDSRS